MSLNRNAAHLDRTPSKNGRTLQDRSSTINGSLSQPHVSQGMPPLKLGKTLSFFEFWPTWLMYFPVAVQWLLLAIKHKSLTLPLIANPNLPLSGMVGVPKSQLLNQATDDMKTHILAFITYRKTSDAIENQVRNVEDQMAVSRLSYPLVCKPDIGCRGAGVKLVHHSTELTAAVSAYPIGASIMLQKLADYEPEAGIFYVRHPNEPKGEIISMALKYMPYVVGDGHSTLADLIKNDVRAGKLSHLYEKRHEKRAQEVLPKGQPFRLIFSASHSKGAIFKDAREFITPELTQKLDALMQQVPNLHYGRLDVKFKDIESLTRGETLQIVEINTASSESLHIWDSNTGLKEAVSSLLLQYRTLFRLGAATRAQGYQPPGVLKLLKHWQLERRLTKHYPETD